LETWKSGDPIIEIVFEIGIEEQRKSRRTEFEKGVLSPGQS
jgi:hypothetical protein